MENAALNRRYERERRVRKQAENLLEDKSRELFETNQKLKNMLVDLEAQVQARTEEYKKAMLEAESANKAKSTFLATMSHEIRTPLNGIISGLGLVKDKISESEYRAHIEIAYNSGNALLGIMNDILDLSKIEAGHMQMEESVFDLHQELNLVADLFSSRAQEKNLKLKIDIDKYLSKWWIGDAGRIKQILLNFVSNAIKFTDHGAIVIAAAQTTDGEICFSVADDGIGIPEDKRHLLFQDFQQVDTSYSRRFSGTGLGLAICRSLTELMGGTIGVDSIEGEGSRFWVKLPLKQGEAVEVAFNKVQEPDELFGRILLAEDSSTNALVAQALLRLKKLNVDRVVDGADAVTAWRSKPYDLILMDLSMPNMDGFEATKIIRQEEKSNKKIPILALTANVSSEDLEACMTVGMNGVISKPIQRNELFSKLIEWLPDAQSEHKVTVSKNNDNNILETEVFSHEKFADDWQDLPVQVQFDIITLFADEMKEREIAILNLIRRKKWVPAKKEAHALKSAAGNVGANRLYKLAAKLEKTLVSDHKEAKAHAALLTDVCSATAIEINQHRERLRYKLSA